MPMEYLVLKWIHIISATVLFGTGIGLAFFFFAAHQLKEITAIKFATRMVVIGDLIFTTPAGVVQIISGTLLILQVGWTLDATWLWLALILFVFAGACWLPVVWIQVKMHRMVRNATALSELTTSYWRYYQIWVVLGTLAFPALIAVFWLMIAKPGG